MKNNKKNPLIKDQKRIRSINVGSEDENEIRKFIIIIVVIVVLVGIVYAITELTKKDTKSNEEVVTGEIDYNTLSIGMLLNRPEKEYYVIIYDAENPDAILYSAMINKYDAKTSKLKLYYCDLGNALNNKYYNVGSDNKSNPNATGIDELDLGDLTLIKVKDGKITKYVENIDEIKQILK